MYCNSIVTDQRVVFRHFKAKKHGKLRIISIYEYPAVTNYALDRVITVEYAMDGLLY